MMGKSVFFSEGTAGQMKSAPSFAKDDDSTLPKEPNGSKIGLGPKPIWGMSVKVNERDYITFDAELPEFGVRIMPSGKRFSCHERTPVKELGQRFLKQHVAARCRPSRWNRGQLRSNFVVGVSMRRKIALNNPGTWGMLEKLFWCRE